jgi:hypothetical protein
MITPEFKKKVLAALLEDREMYPDLSDARYAQKINVNASVFSQLKNGKTEKLASVDFWVDQAYRLNVSINKKQWNVARTAVYVEIEEQIKFCKDNGKAVVVIDECGVGKTFCTKHILKSIKNGYYIDCSQAKTKSQFIRYLAKTLGIDPTGKLFDLKQKIKYYINIMNDPIIALDDAGYVDNNVFIEIIEIWNATNCGWLMLGDDSLETKITNGRDRKKVGYRALFSRFSEEYVHCVPVGENRTAFLQQLIGDVAAVNMKQKSKLNTVIKKCIVKEKTLRYLDTAIDLVENPKPKATA